MKEPDYIMNMMSTYGTVNEVDGASTKRHYKDGDGNEVTISFNYTEVFNNHFKYRHVVDDNNNNRMQPISIEQTWATKQWSHRPYAFLIGVTTVNAQRGYENLGGHEQQPTLNFRRTLASQLIENRFIPAESEARKSHERSAKKQKVGVCKLISLPAFSCFSGSDIVDCKGAYNQFRCVCTKVRVRTYCQCSPGFIRCKECFITHFLDVENA